MTSYSSFPELPNFFEVVNNSYLIAIFKTPIRSCNITLVERFGKLKLNHVTFGDTQPLSVVSMECRVISLHEVQTITLA